MKPGVHEFRLLTPAEADATGLPLDIVITQEPSGRITFWRRGGRPGLSAVAMSSNTRIEASRTLNEMWEKEGPP